MRILSEIMKIGAVLTIIVCLRKRSHQKSNAAGVLKDLVLDFDAALAGDAALPALRQLS